MIGDGTGDDEDWDYGLYCNFGNTSRIIFTNNIVENTYNSEVELIRQLGETVISHNTFSGQYPVVYFGTYNDDNVTTHQEVSNNTFEMTDADPHYWGAAITFNGAYDFYTSDSPGKNSDITVTGNIIQNLPYTSYPSEDSCFYQWNGIRLLNEDHRYGSL